MASIFRYRRIIYLSFVLITLLFISVSPVYASEDTTGQNNPYLLKHVGEEDVKAPTDVDWNDFINEEDIFYAKDLDYEIEFTDTIYEDEENSFHIYYPQIHFKDGRSAKKINEIIRAKACDQMDSMYPEFLYNSDLDKGRRESRVSYEITYMDNELFSVIFYDHCFLGSIFSEYFDLRTVTIDLTNEENYPLEEVIDADREFSEKVYNRFKGVSEENWEERTALDAEVMKEALNKGMTDDSRYRAYLYLLSNKQIGIAFTYHYGDEQRIARGYELIPLAREDYEDYFAIGDQPDRLWEQFLEDDVSVEPGSENEPSGEIEPARGKGKDKPDIDESTAETILVWLLLIKSFL